MPNLLFIMTPGVNLSTWKDNGSFHREIKPCLKYAECGYNVRILSFGPERYDFAGLHKRIEVVTVKKGALWAHLTPLTHREHFRWADVIKTNQSYLCWVFVIAARMFSRPILLRCGYVHGEYLETTIGVVLRTRIYKYLESFAFGLANRVQVPTNTLSKWVRENYKVHTGRISVVPNFVDTEVFKPISTSSKKPRSVISVGRLHPVKRFDLLLRACALLREVSVTIIGEGPERDKLSALASHLKVNLALPGSVLNERLPEILAAHNVFAITSLREGHPKALIEAMSCGLPCVVSYPGHEGYGGAVVSVQPSECELSLAIRDLFDKADLATKNSDMARSYVLENYDFTAVFNKEKQALEQLIGC